MRLYDKGKEAYIFIIQTNGANKGVVRGIFPEGKEPYALSNPEEKLHTLVSIASINGRMVSSIQNVGIIQNLLVEATKKAKDMAGIEYDYNKLD